MIIQFTWSGYTVLSSSGTFFGHHNAAIRTITLSASTSPIDALVQYHPLALSSSLKKKKKMEQNTVFLNVFKSGRTELFGNKS